MWEGDQISHLFLQDLEGPTTFGIKHKVAVWQVYGFLGSGGIH
jgi:hypothetical protein